MNPHQTIRLMLAAACLLTVGCATSQTRADEAAPAKDKPLIRDFMGLNGHTVSFKSDLYRPVARLVRDYHNMTWDLGDSTANATTFPLARNNVNWETMYRGWKNNGFQINFCAQFRFEEKDWTDMSADAYAYGKSVASFFGPSSRALITSLQIGNEPGEDGKYSRDSYRTIFENMARGAKEADPKLLIVTCNMSVGEGTKWSQSTDVLLEVDPALYDAIATHNYPEIERGPTWRKSYPENPKMPDFLGNFQKLVAWRDAHAPDKQVWITEFGYDASSKKPDPDGPDAEWVSVTDMQQAQYLIRTFLCVSAMDVDRAYMYFHNDSDQPTHHGAAGLTRNYEPKPSYHAQSHLFATLGSYRFARVVSQREGDLYVYEYINGENPGKKVWAVWSPTGDGDDREVEMTLPGVPGKVTKAQRMPLNAKTDAVDVEQSGSEVTLLVTESPAYLWIEE